MEARIRKTIVYIEDVLIEGGRAVPRPYRAVAAAAVIANPWAGQGFVEDLRPGINAIAPQLGALLVPMLLDAAPAAEVEAYGKAAIVGTHGEIEHASAMIHTLRFGNQLRERVGGVSFLPFTNKRAAPGAAIDVPMKHRTAEGTRSHFLTISFVIPDAPGPDEIVVALGVATSGRPHARIGDRYEDMKELGVDQTGSRTKATV
jgi:Amino acid synthesis